MYVYIYISELWSKYSQKDRECALTVIINPPIAS